jgi:hypothetical protein
MNIGFSGHWRKQSSGARICRLITILTKALKLGTVESSADKLANYTDALI